MKEVLMRTNVAAGAMVSPSMGGPIRRWLAVATFAAALQACGPAQTANRVNADLAPGNDGGRSETPMFDARGMEETGTGGTPGGGGPGMMNPPELPTPRVDAAPEVAPPMDMARPMDMRMDVPVVVDMAPVVDVAPPVDMTMEPPKPVVMVMAEAPPAVTNLTTSGMLDWIHIGLGNGTTLNRKRGVTALLTLNFATSEFQTRYNDRPVAFSWSDGMPTMSQNETRDGSNIGPAAQSGFEILATGNVTKLRTLTVYVGAWNSTARLTVEWTGTGAPAGIVHMEEPFSATVPGRDRMFRIRFQPTRVEHRLRVRWRLQSVSDTYGNVTMQAASLTE